MQILSSAVLKHIRENEAQVRGFMRKNWHETMNKPDLYVAEAEARVLNSLWDGAWGRCDAGGDVPISAIIELITGKADE